MDIELTQRVAKVATTFKPRVVVVIPVFKHPGLLAEAVESVLAQTASFDIATIIVNDGCPFPETEDVGLAYAMSYESVFYLRKPNGGLSSARNFGIDFAVQSFPDYEAVYLLDADNRITRSALQSLMNFLKERPDIDWVYPNIDKFGIAWSGNYTTEYSRLLHVTFDNICEAGSLITRRLIDAGVRFDISMKAGFEDWEFWLHALEKGFKGANHPYFGFEYRQRAESMLRDSNRSRDSIMSYIHTKHKTLFKTDTLLRYEHEEAPRYTHVAVGTYHVDTFTDPDAPHETCRLDEFVRRFWAARNEPDTYGTSPFLLWMPSTQIQALSRLKLLHNVLWLSERLTEKYNFVAIRLEASKSKYEVSVRTIDEANPLGSRVSGWMTSQQITAACAEDRTDDWARSLRNPVPSPSVAELVISAPFLLPETQGAQLSSTNALLATVGALRDSSFRPVDAPKKWIWRQPYLPSRSRYHELLRQAGGTHAVMPRLPSTTGRLRVGMILPIASFGGVEKVAYAISRVLVAAGCEVHLFVLGKPIYERHRENDGLFASINFLAADYPIWGGPHTYAGHELQMETDYKAMAPDLLGLLNGLDIVVNNQVAGANAVLGSLRRRGVKVINYVHVLDQTPQGRDAGHPYLSLAFEHVYDAILTCSKDMLNWLCSMGVPPTKLRRIDNAPSYEMADDAVAAILAHRLTQSDARPLRAIFLGRFDAQKGIERLHGVVRELQRRNVSVDWRVVGRDVLDATTGPSWQQRFREIGTTVLPPIYSPIDLSRAFAWADVLVLPSRWEGAPLTILEAQRLGCVPLCTAVGAVEELVTDGKDGLLVSPHNETGIVDGLVNHLTRLSEDRQTLRRLSANAAERTSTLKWSRSAQPLLELLHEWFPHQLKVERGHKRRLIQIRSQAAVLPHTQQSAKHPTAPSVARDRGQGAQP